MSSEKSSSSKILQCIFTSCFVSTVFVFCVPQALAIFHTVDHQRCVVVFPFKIHIRLFSTRTEKETKLEKQPLLTAKEHAVYLHCSLSIIHPGWTKVCRDQFLSSLISDEHCWWTACTVHFKWNIPGEQRKRALTVCPPLFDWCKLRQQTG